MASFAESLERGLSDDRIDERLISHEGQIARARELAARASINHPNPFTVGDLVTPRTDAPIACAGEPHVAVETRRKTVAYRDWSAGKPGSTSFGGLYDMRVAHVMNDSTVLHWVESCYFEAYDPAVHDKKKDEC